MAPGGFGFERQEGCPCMVEGPCPGLTLPEATPPADRCNKVLFRDSMEDARSRRCGTPHPFGAFIRGPSIRTRSDGPRAEANFRESRATLSLEIGLYVASSRTSVMACRVDGLTIIAHARDVRGIRRVRSHFREAETPEPISKNPPGKGGSAYPAGGRETLGMAIESFPDLADFRKPHSCHGRSAPGQAASGRVALQPRRPFCSHSSPSPSTCTAPSAAICTGRCRTSWRSPTAPDGASPPSARSLPPQGQPRSTVSRHLAQLAERASSRVSGALVASMPTSSPAASCRRRAGCPTSAIEGVPPPGREEQAGKKTGYARARFAKSRE